RPGLTMRQRRYLRQPPLLALKNALLRVIDEPVDAGRLLATLEAYETEGRPSDAEELAGAVGRLSRSTKAEERELGRRLAWHYRGTNLRFAVSEELLMRFLPKQAEPTLQPVSDTILGVPVSGQSLTHNDLRVRLLRSHGDLVRVMAGQRYQSTDAQRREEVERKMARRVESQFERQTQPVLSRLNQNFAKRVLTPLSHLQLPPEAVVERPADERMNVRLRVAG